MAKDLAIDIGNTRTKFGWFDKKELLHAFQLNNADLANNDKLMESYEPANIIISSVNDKAEALLGIDRFKAQTIHLNSSTKLPIKLEYQSPETLGKDRIAGAVGAAVQFPKKNVLVIDAGSCITYDLMTERKSYLGGAISPGIQMRLQAMNNYTDQLPLLYWEQPKRPETLGNTTISSMLSGVVNGLIAEMNGFISSYGEQFSDLKVVLTGGDANFFEKELKNGIFADPNLVLKGLHEILDYNLT